MSDPPLSPSNNESIQNQGCKKEILIKACEYKRSLNICNDCHSHKYGDCVILNSHPTGAPRAQMAEYEYVVADDCTYDVFIEYAAEVGRPIKISANGHLVTENGCNNTTGGWDSGFQKWEKQGELFAAKGYNKLVLERGAPFPHIRAIKLVLQ